MNDGHGRFHRDSLALPRLSESGSTVVPVYGTPRIIAGEAINTDQNKCQLKPLRRSDYNVTFTDALVFTFPPDFPEGDSLLFAGITAAGTQNLIAPLATAVFTFSP